jgi:hypothetical protein
MIKVVVPGAGFSPLLFFSRLGPLFLISKGFAAERDDALCFSLICSVLVATQTLEHMLILMMQN